MVYFESSPYSKCAVVGESDGEEVTARNGRYGPYVQKGKESRSLENEEQLLVGVVDMEWRANDPWVELVDVGGQFSGPGLNADGCDVTTGVSVSVPTQLVEVNGHRTTVAHSVGVVGT